MILPIVLYGDPVLRKVCDEVGKSHPGIHKLVNDMFETMNAAKGVGLAAAQAGVPLRLFIIDPSNYDDDSKSKEKQSLKNFKRVFINPKMLEETGEQNVFNEGCLSIPGIREEVLRKPAIKIQYLDENFIEHIEGFDGLPARIILHEYDHINGVLFTDKINKLRKQLLKRKLKDISRGIVDVAYKIKIPFEKSKKISI